MTESQSTKQLLMNVPYVWDFYSHFWAIKRKPRAHKGVYETYAEAAAAAPKGGAVGYNQKTLGEHPQPEMLTAGLEVGVFNPRDYPLVVWLAKAFEDGKTVFDFGGNVGLGYYAYKRFMRYPEGLRWVVCEVEEFCKAGRRVAEERGAKNLEFTEDFAEAEGMDILVTCGTIQFLEDSFGKRVARLKRKPKHLLLHRSTMSDHPTFYTLENIGYSYCPYRVTNKQELFGELEGAGYELIDTWTDAKELKIPFHPKRMVKGYTGAYFKLAE
jgi:putative methyltransferase (TIGR04325 family)